MAMSKGKKSKSYSKSVSLKTGAPVTGTLPTPGQKYGGGQTQGTGGRGNAQRGMTMNPGGGKSKGTKC